MKKIVIGIDISKEKIDASAIDVRNTQQGVQKLDYQRFENRPLGFRRMLVWARHLIKGVALDEVLFCCETTGGYDRSLCDYIYAKDLDIWRESALQIKRSMGVRKGKDDRADSLMIAEYAMRHMDKAVIYETPSDNVRELKALLQYRHKLSKSMSFILRDARKSIKALEKSVKQCEQQILELIKGDGELSRSYRHIVSVSGIGIVNATALIAYSNNFRGITTANRMASYYGIASFRDTSGTSVDKKAYVKCYSNSLLKAYLTQAAVWTIRENSIYHDYYLRLKKKGKPYGIIINNARNKLIHLVFSLVENDTDYEQNHEYIRMKRRVNADFATEFKNIN